MTRPKRSAAESRTSKAIMCSLYGDAVADAPIKVRWNAPCPHQATMITGAGQYLCGECKRYQLQKSEAKQRLANALVDTLRSAKPIGISPRTRAKGPR